MVEEKIDNVISEICNKYKIGTNEVVRLCRAIINSRNMRDTDIDLLSVGNYYHVTYIRKYKNGHRFSNIRTKNKKEFLEWINKNIKYH